MDDIGIILCVDDDSTVLSALRTVISANFGTRLRVELAESGEEALEIDEELRAQGQEISLVISDFMMPGLRGDELLVRLEATSPKTVKILLTGQSDLSGVKRAINEANLYRFLEKPFVNDDIVLTIRSAIRAYRQEKDLFEQNEKLRQMNADLEALVTSRTRDLREKNQQLEILSITDKLTGLLNRRKLEEILEEELMRSHRYDIGLSIVMVDIDHFKRVNDHHGHLAGDTVLIEIAELLRTHTRATDVVGRWGGEEFLIICRHSKLEEARSAAEKLREAIAGHGFGDMGSLTASFGVGTCRTGDTPASLLARADAALYQAKDIGRNRLEVEVG